ncbi:MULTISPECIES: GlxA family transcriptional regulator [Pseudomonas]|uniref:GlxA family transcriptional regulator n=1 Tax=Pseudomonas TaxID=286 RepID=UPI001BE606E5|nr:MULTISPECIES: helix-turn-helix domain-containing protein [Pseudomonas]MBT2339838.1 helix-turn-helix domain-containing protein [Pseudomonas fluorescens]MCD4530353.1 helix-turn-helix domain-containing protein [Pseudomonas sp. C3-2018]
MQSIRVAVLAFDGVSLFHLSVPGMVLGAAQSTPGEPHYTVSYCAETPGMVTSDQGLDLAVAHGLELFEASDVIVIPAWGDQMTAASLPLIKALQVASGQGKLIVGLCLGAFVLGDAGLLNGKEATTHWAAREAFARRFPAVRFRPEVLYVSDSNIMTSAGTVAAIDCCLHLVRQKLGADVANRTAKMLVTPPHRQGGQAQYVEHPVPQLSSETHLSDVLAWARESLASDLSLDVLADRAKMSRRTFTRRFREATGSTVSKWLNAQRVVRAQALLETTDLPIECVAGEAGFGTPLSLRQQFGIHLGTSPSEYRRTFFREMNPDAKAGSSESAAEPVNQSSTPLSRRNRKAS